MNRTMLATARFTMAFLLLSLGGHLALSQETSRRTLHKITYLNEPAEISNIRVEGKNILFGRNFSAGGDWLRGMTFDVRNASDKTITYISISILFQPGNRTEKGALHELSVGFNKTAYNSTDTKGRGIKLRPGELLSFVVAEKDYLNISRLLRETGLNAEAVKVSMIIHNVNFEDDSRVEEEQ